MSKLNTLKRHKLNIQPISEEEEEEEDMIAVPSRISGNDKQFEGTCSFCRMYLS